jgi:hypothetical protein
MKDFTGAGQMGRIKKVDVTHEINYEEEPMVIKKEETFPNGIIPVKYDSVEVFYDTHEKLYFAVVRMEGKKLRFELVK